MKIILAQGNPGPKYQHTRHNIGFMALDAFAEKKHISFSNKPKFHAEIAEFSHKGQKVLLVKPLTFYNETGLAARALSDFYKINIATDLLVIHDELALPFGIVRTRLKGSDAGNNGVKSLNAHLGQDYARIRVGIFNSLHTQTNDVDFVLSTFSPEEKVMFSDIFSHIEHFIEKFLENNFEPTSRSLSLS
ncbi:MAG TPA: aminoacyl-tRNA hydrolase [Candidatus Saccharimonadales bacterium]|nr:aminoacyl-tRNA hydrolase [Candidatus Saccharimonadales bacterium]